MTNRQRAFIREYLKDFNATRAAKAAGYSEKTAYSIGQRLLKDVEVGAAIRAKINEIQMGPDEIKNRLADMARGNIADLMDVTPTGYAFNLMTEDDQGNKIVNPHMKLVKKIKQKTTTMLGKNGDDKEIIETELELYSALDALEKLGKVHALFTEKTEVTGAGGGAIALELFKGALDKVYGDGSDNTVHPDGA